MRSSMSAGHHRRAPIMKLVKALLPKAPPLDLSFIRGSARLPPRQRASLPLHGLSRTYWFPLRGIGTHQAQGEWECCATNICSRQLPLAFWRRQRHRTVIFGHDRGSHSCVPTPLASYLPQSFQWTLPAHELSKGFEKALPQVSLFAAAAAPYLGQMQARERRTGACLWASSPEAFWQGS